MARLRTVLRLTTEKLSFSNFLNLKCCCFIPNVNDLISSINFQKIIPKANFFKSSEVLRHLNEEANKTRSGKDQEYTCGTTFLQRPHRLTKNKEPLQDPVFLKDDNEIYSEFLECMMKEAYVQNVTENEDSSIFSIKNDSDDECDVPELISIEQRDESNDFFHAEMNDEKKKKNIDMNVKTHGRNEDFCFNIELDNEVIFIKNQLKVVDLMPSVLKTSLEKITNHISEVIPILNSKLTENMTGNTIIEEDMKIPTENDINERNIKDLTNEEINDNFNEVASEENIILESVELEALPLPQIEYAREIEAKMVIICYILLDSF